MTWPLTSLRSPGKDSPCAKKAESPDYTHTIDQDTSESPLRFAVFELRYTQHGQLFNDMHLDFH